MSESKEYRSFAGEIKLLQKQNDFLYDVEIWLLNDKVNRNRWKYVNLEAHRASFAGTPILVAYKGGQIGDGHNYRVKRDKNGKEYASFTDATAERIVGALSDDETDIRLVERDGYTWVVGKGQLWRWYAYELVEKIEKDAEQGRDLSVSIETLVTESRQEGDVEIEEKYYILGTTILGDKVPPAVADARIKALSEMGSEFKTLKLRAASYAKNTNKKDIKGVKTMGEYGKKQLADLSARFEGYTARAALSDDNGIHVALLSDDGFTACYTLSGENETIAPEKITKCNAQTVFAFGEDCTVSVDSFELTEKTANENARLCGELEKAKKDLAAAEALIKTMKTAEEERRCKECEATVISALNSFNADRDDPVDESAVAEVKADVANGVYTNSVDANGAFIGAKLVEERVLSICAKKDIEARAAKARANKGIFVYDKMRSDGEGHKGVTTIDDILERHGI